MQISQKFKEDETDNDKSFCYLAIGKEVFL